MEGGESILEAIYEADNLDDVDDVEMVDIEEGECLELNNKPKSGQTSGRDVKMVNQGTQSRNRRRKENKKRNKKKKSAVPKVTDINRFVLDTCRLLKERKSYLVWTAIGCLGRSALSELVNEMSLPEAISLITLLRIF